jgi:hypothetical protein
MSEVRAGELNGTKIAPLKIAALVRQAGWRDRNMIEAVAVALAESGGFDHAVNENENGSTDRGLWQINSVHVDAGEITVVQCWDPVASTNYSYELYRRYSYTFGPWVAFKSGAYKNHLRDATRGVANFWRQEYGLPFLREP